MASNVNRGPTGSPLSANSQIWSLNTQSCKNLEGGNLTNLAIQQKTNSQWTKEGKKKKGEEEKRKAFTTHVMGCPNEGVRGRAGISISMFTPQNNGIRFLCQISMNWAFSSLRTTSRTHWCKPGPWFLRHSQFPLKFIQGKKGSFSC